jgi:hypothetical protein
MVRKRNQYLKRIITNISAGKTVQIEDLRTKYNNEQDSHAEVKDKFEELEKLAGFLLLELKNLC